MFFSRANKWCHLLVYALSLQLCCAGTDSAEPIELISEFDIDSLGLSKVNMQNDSPNGYPEMHQILKFIEEKFLSFAALNIRPNFSNIFRHMERMARAFVKLNTKVESMHSQLEEIRSLQQNLSSINHYGEKSMNLLKTGIDSVEKKISNLESLMQKPPSQDAQHPSHHFNEQLRRIETKIDSSNAMLHDSLKNQGLHHVNSKLELIHKDVSNLVSTEDQKIREVKTSVASIVQNAADRMTRTPCATTISPEQLLDSSKESILLQQLSTLHRKMDSQYNATETLSRTCRTLISNGQLSLQTQEKASELLDIMQDIPGVITDAAERMEIISDKLTSKIDDAHIQLPSNCSKEFSTAVISLQNIEKSADTILQKLGAKLDQTKDHVAHVPNSNKEPARISSNICSNTSDKIQPLLLEISHQQERESKLLHNVYYDVKDLLASLNISSNSLNNNRNKPNFHDEYSKTLIKEVSNIQSLSNVTIDKLDFIISFLGYLQLDQTNAINLIDGLTDNNLSVEQKIDDMLREINEISKRTVTNENKNSAPKQIDLEVGDSTIPALQKSLTGMSDKCTSNENLLLQMNKTWDLLSNKMENLINTNMKISDNLQNKLSSHVHSLDNLGSDKTKATNDSRSSLSLIQSWHQSYLHNHNALSLKVEQLMEIFLGKMQWMTHYLHEIENIKTILQTSGGVNDESTQWSSTANIAATIKDVQSATEKLNQLHTSIVRVIDDGLVRIADLLGQSQTWFQQSSSQFTDQHSDGLSKLKNTVSTIFNKGFENLHFMYQYLSGKLDKIHQIVAHNLEDCSDIQKSGHTVSGIYTIYPRNSKEIKVYCDMDSSAVGWTVIQRRGNFGKTLRTSFNQSWQSYKYGFGNLEEEFWLGNENIHTLTTQGNYVLRIDFHYTPPDRLLPRYKRKFWHDLKNGSHLYAHYIHFQMHDEQSNYSIGHSGYGGIHPYDGFEGRTGISFSTFDHHTSNHAHYCTRVQGGGWWYGIECFRFALNSKYKDHYWDDGNIFTGITWGGTADIALLKHVEMKILPHAMYQRLLVDNVSDK